MSNTAEITPLTQCLHDLDNPSSPNVAVFFWPSECGWYVPPPYRPIHPSTTAITGAAEEDSHSTKPDAEESRCAEPYQPPPHYNRGNYGVAAMDVSLHNCNAEDFEKLLRLLKAQIVRQNDPYSLALSTRKLQVRDTSMMLIRYSTLSSPNASSAAVLHGGSRKTNTFSTTSFRLRIGGLLNELSVEEISNLIFGISGIMAQGVEYVTLGLRCVSFASREEASIVQNTVDQRLWLSPFGVVLCIDAAAQEAVQAMLLRAKRTHFKEKFPRHMTTATFWID